MAERATRFYRIAALVGVVLFTACAPAQPASSGSAIVRQGAQAASAGGGNFDSANAPGAASTAGATSSDKTLVVGIATEVRGFSPLNAEQQKYVEDFIQGNLYLQDAQGRWTPALAAETPSLDNGTWRLFEDGTSETLYHLKQGVKWHDGAEFTSKDLVLFWKVGRDPEIPYEGRDRATVIKNMEPLDDYTLRVTWNTWEPEADTIDLRMWWPMPSHILEDVYNTDKQRFINHPFWSTDFVGLGPYKLSKLEFGSHLELTANESYVMGAPRIKNIVIKFYQDTNVLVAGLLAGEVHLSLHGNVREGALSMADGIVLGTQWSASHEGKVLFNPYRINLLAVQQNREFQRPTALSDVRVRQALLVAMDRKTYVEQKFNGFTEVANAWLTTDNPDYSTLSDAVTPYDYDPERAARLFGDAGWQKGPDGILVNAAGERFELENRALGRDAENAATAVSDYWKRAGVDPQLLVIPSARANDNEWMAKYSGVRNHAMVSAPVGGGTNRYICRQAPSENNRWLSQSQNPAGYCSPEMEQANDALERAFPFNARLGPFKDMMRIALRDLPYLPLYYESEVVAVRSNVSGIDRVPPKNRGRVAMSSHLWTIQ